MYKLLKVLTFLLLISRGLQNPFVRCGRFQFTDGQMNAASIVGNVTYRSEMHCAGICLSHMLCRSFTIDGESCYLLADYTGQFVATKDCCPWKLGYEIYNLGGKPYCLNGNGWSDRPRPQAAQACQDDGSHLVLVENGKMLDDLFYVSRDAFQITATQYKFFVDGENIYGNETFYSWDGKPLPFFRWETGQPMGMPYVLVKHNGTHYEMGNNNGMSDNPVVCQYG